MKRLYFLLVILMLLPVAGPGCRAQTRQNPLRPSELLKKPGAYLNHSVEVEIVERLYGPPTAAALAAVEYGQVEVETSDALAEGRLSLVPAAFQPQDPNRYRHKFSQVLKNPLRVRGKFLKDEDLSQSYRRPMYVIRVSFLEPLALGPAQTVHSLAELQANRANWDRKLIVYEGVYEESFEVLALDKEIWLSTEYGTVIVGEPKSAPGIRRTNRVRVTGTLLAKPGARYGHLGGYNFEVLASKLEYLGAIAP